MKKLIALLCSVCMLMGLVATVIPVSVFAETEGDWGYYVQDGEAYVDWYYGTDPDIVIPETLGGYPVTVIDYEFFNLKGGFNWHVDGPCTLTIHAGIRDIMINVYKEMLIPHSAIYVAEDNPWYSSKDGVLFNKDQTVLISYPPNATAKTYKIPSTVKEIEANAFSMVSNIHLIIPASVTTINEAFRDAYIQEFTIYAHLDERIFYIPDHWRFPFGWGNPMTIRAIEGTDIADFAQDPYRDWEGFVDAFTGETYHKADWDHSWLTFVPLAEPTAEILEGNANQWAQGNQEGASFRITSGTVIQNITIDGAQIEPADYSVSEEDNTVTLNPEFLVTLAEGEHNIEINVIDTVSALTSTAAGTFTVTAPAEETPVEAAPQTGDEHNLILYVLLINLALAMILSVRASRKETKPE